MPTLEELTTQVEELTTTNADLQKSLDDTLEKLKVFEDAKKVSEAAEKADVIDAITKKADIAADELKEKSLEELVGIDAALGKAKLNFKTVTSTSDEDKSGKPTGLTVGRWDEASKSWVT